MSHPATSREAGTEAAAVPAASPWRPVLMRAAVGTLALIGLSGIGAVSMLAGLDGAHASPPAVSSVWMASASSSVAPKPAPNPAASGTAQSSNTATAPTGATAGANSRSEPTACPTKTADGRIILNLATMEDLRRIPGIGPKRAEAILGLRTKLKRFKRNSQLLRVRGIGPKSLMRMQSHFVLDPPPGSDCTANVTASSR